MSASRRIRRARGDHKRTVPPEAAALMFERDGDDFSVRMLVPAGMDATKPPPPVAMLAALCAQHARELLEAAARGETTDGETTQALDADTSTDSSEAA